jgi:hypothetical protein
MAVVMRRHFVSYPKSGRSWIRYCFHQMEIASSVYFHHDSFEFNDSSKPLPSYDFAQRLTSCTEIDRVVYMHRDPRDILVSLYHQVTGRFDTFFHYKESLSEFIRDDYFGAKNLKLFQDQWNMLCDMDIAYRISYEQCHVDLFSVLKGLLQYYELSVDEASIRSAISSSKFENMRRVEESCVFSERWLRPKNGYLKTRIGKPLNFEASLKLDDLEYLNDYFFN